jgi:hypothetical protein
MQYVEIMTRNFATGVVMSVGSAPYLVVLRTQDALATAPTNYSAEAQDIDTGDIILDDQDTAGNLDFLYVGSLRQFKGVIVDVDKPNGTVSELTVKYRKSDDTWVDISDTDGTKSGTTTLAIDGIVNWTVPTDWKKDNLTDIGDTSFAFPDADTDYFWTRWEFSVALDAEVEIVSMVAQQEFTEPEYPSGLLKDLRSSAGPGKLGGITVKMDAGTGNIIVNTFNLDSRRTVS